MFFLLNQMLGYKEDEVLKWKTEKFLFWSEYLVRKRIVENLK